MTNPQPATSSQASISAQRPALLPYLALLSGTLALSLSGLFIHWADAPGMVTSFYRMTTATICLLPFAVRGLRKMSLPGPRSLLLPLLGGLFVALDHGFWSTSIHYTQIGTATLLNNTAPLWVAVFAFFLWRERLSSRFWAGWRSPWQAWQWYLGTTCCTVRISAAVIFKFIFQPLLCRIFSGNSASTGNLSHSHLHLAGNRRWSRFPALWKYRPWKCAQRLQHQHLSDIYQRRNYFSNYRLFLRRLCPGHFAAAIVAPSMIAQPVLTMLLAIPIAGELLLPGQWLGSAAVLAGIYIVNSSHQSKESLAVADDKSY